MATPNYSFIKRQKDLAKKAKKEEKKQAKLRGEVLSESDDPDQSDSIGSDVVSLDDTAQVGQNPLTT
jgi:hypothetical protein